MGVVRVAYSLGVLGEAGSEPSLAVGRNLGPVILSQGEEDFIQHLTSALQHWGAPLQQGGHSCSAGLVDWSHLVASRIMINDWRSEGRMPDCR